jgi:hypothetical protein
MRPSGLSWRPGSPSGVAEVYSRVQNDRATEGTEIIERMSNLDILCELCGSTLLLS